MFYSIGAHYPSGQYVVLYDGQGTIVYGSAAVKDNALSTPGRDVVNVTPANGFIWLRITATDPNHNGDYIRNIRVIMPGFESNYATQIFHSTFLASIQKYKTIRFKDWLETDGSTQSSWSTRTKVSNARWNTPHAAGVPIEILIALANRNQSDIWVNMPHMADDNYITQFATLVRDQLDPAHRVYVEYSNEVWNGAPGFPQSGWVQQQGIAMWPQTPPDAFTKQINWHGMRTAQMCDIWKNAWGAQSNRVICVMGAQAANSWTASQALDCPLWTQGAPCYAHGISAIAIGPYFGGYLGNSTFQPQVLSWTSDPDGGLVKLFTEIITGGVTSGGPSGGALQSAFAMISSHVSVANARGLYVVAYEGGSHLHDTLYNSTVISLFNTANHDTRMGGVYDQYLAGWRNSGGRLFVHFINVGVPDNYGAFGALDYQDQTSSPKYDALMRFIDNNPCWWNGCQGIVNTYLPMLVR
jgi:hypothetical protein